MSKIVNNTIPSNPVKFTDIPLGGYFRFVKDDNRIYQRLDTGAFSADARAAMKGDQVIRVVEDNLITVCNVPTATCYQLDVEETCVIRGYHERHKPQ